ncbi:MAG: pilin [Candidatus Nealsonbacteria bacterium]|nr:pilin [Candidatus Nealsonbacteria bacterium]
MKLLKTIIFILIIIVFAGYWSLESAQELSALSAEARLQNPLGAETIEEFIHLLINFIWRVSIIVAPALIIIGAFYFLFSFGNPERIKAGQKIILYTIIGFVIIMISWGIIDLLRITLGREGT